MTYSTHWKENKCLQTFVSNPGKRKNVGKTKLRWQDNITLCFEEMGVTISTGFTRLRTGSTDDKTLRSNQ